MPGHHKEEYKLNYCALPKHREWNGGLLRPTLKPTEVKKELTHLHIVTCAFLMWNIFSLKQCHLQHDIELSPY